MQYLIIEHFKKGKVLELYQRFEQRGRMLPDGVKYINSWVDKEVKTCYQIMESESLEKLLKWTENWNDLANFEIIRVLTSAEAKALVFSNPNKE